ncbi:MAG: very short patch repair endonuclease [Planctomycetaceae bacterium]|nr:very short patch repair endonuclease [Planctomycetaceae bacterium]
MADVMTVAQRSRVMSRNRGKDTTPERYLTALLEAAGVAFIRHDATLPGKPDFVFTDERLVVFVDGDFWHGWRFPTWRHRLTEFWREKIEKNRIRDQRNFRRLRRAGWRVARIWEHEVEEDPQACVFRIAALAGKAVDRGLIEARYADMPALKRRNRLPKP